MTNAHVFHSQEKEKIEVNKKSLYKQKKKKNYLYKLSYR